jgi:hypothetical protein
MLPTSGASSLHRIAGCHDDKVRDASKRRVQAFFGTDMNWALPGVRRWETGSRGSGRVRRLRLV